LLKTDNVALADEVAADIKQLGEIGLGGRRSRGLGKFVVNDGAVIDIADSADKNLKIFLQENGTDWLLLSTALPAEGEYGALAETSFSLLKRSGFVSSYTHSLSALRRKDVFAVKSGALFKKTFCGCVVNVSPPDGMHPVFRNLKAFWCGVTL
jgi:CRISPR-associated protein Csm4